MYDQQLAKIEEPCWWARLFRRTPLAYVAWQGAYRTVA
jgi:hypothetical protein